jgi:hypothetical protein
MGRPAIIKRNLDLKSVSLSYTGTAEIGIAKIVDLSPAGNPAKIFPAPIRADPSEEDRGRANARFEIIKSLFEPPPKTRDWVSVIAVRIIAILY